MFWDFTYFTAKNSHNVIQLHSTSPIHAARGRNLSPALEDNFEEVTSAVSLFYRRCICCCDFTPKSKMIQ